MKHRELLSKIKKEALKLESPDLFAPVRADELFAYDGEEFVDMLYRRILKREPDAAGRAHYLALAHRFPKPLLVYFFSRSEEARDQQIEITGVYSALIGSCLKVIPIGLLSVIKKTALRVGTLFFSPTVKENDKLDYFRFYRDFEEEFRGSEKEIEHNLNVYLPLLEAADNVAVDIGSGRGEWVKMLKKEGFNVRGVEINPYFTGKCQEEGLEIIKKDAFKFLKDAQDYSIGVITAFHLIEHLDHQRRLLFLKEIHRVLKSGGILILETPNPRNILVSAGDFWRDSEHTAPAFPDTLSLMAKTAGFSEANCYFFNENRTALVPCSDVKFNELQDYVKVSRDFALFARKA